MITKLLSELTMARPVLRLFMLVTVISSFFIISHLQILVSTNRKHVHRYIDGANVERFLHSRLQHQPQDVHNLDLQVAAKYYRNRFNNVNDIRAFQKRLLHADSLNMSLPLVKIDHMKHLINCSNVHQIRLTRLLRTTIHKSTYEAYFRGIKVVTMVYKIRTMNMCIKRTMAILNKGFLDEISKVMLFTRCSFLPGDSFLYEIANHAVLDYPNIIKLLGYCIQDYNYIGDDKTRDVLEHSTVVVFEHADPICPSTLITLPWIERVRHCRDLANLLDMLEHSLLGQISLTDMREKHLMFANNRIKFKDLDLFVTPIEPKCGPEAAIPSLENSKLRRVDNYNYTCGYNITCVEGVCRGFNAKENLFTFNMAFFKSLLDVNTAPARYYDRLTKFLSDLDELQLTAAEIKSELEFLLEDSKSDDGVIEYPVYFLQ